MTSKKKKATEADPNEKVVCRNRKAHFQYNIVESVEAGIVLTGTEVKSLRAGKASLDEAYARMEGNELWLHKAEIPEYEMGNRMNHEPKRKRKLLLHRREISKFAEGKAEQGFTMIPLKIYFRRGRAKVEIAVARGKKIHDKRESMKAKDAKREMARAMQSRRRS